MTNLVQFPGLGLSFELSRVAFSIGDMDIYWYGVCIAFGLCLALVFAFRRCTEFGIDADSMVDVILIGVVLGIASARLYYVAMAPYNYDTIWDVLAVRDGGLAIYGGIIGAFVFGGLAAKWRKVPLLPLFDLVSLGFLIGQGIGRWGNFFNCEAFGGYTDSLLAMRIRRALVNDNMLNADVLNHRIVENGVEYIQVHPTFFYESCWNLCLLLFMLWFRRYKKYDGQMLWIYLLGYGIGRFWIESLRTDQLILFGTGLPVSQALSLVLILVAAGNLIWRGYRHRQKT